MQATAQEAQLQGARPAEVETTLLAKARLGLTRRSHLGTRENVANVENALDLLHL
jgi:hypothetical protein